MQNTPTATITFQLATTPEKTRTDWLSALPDALAFAVGIAVAWWAGWSAGDLIWSLWLSSLVVGYSSIVWTIGQPATALALYGWRTRNDPVWNGRGLLIFFALLLIGTGFFLGFFTLHFGGFHYGHSQFLVGFFPIEVPGGGKVAWADNSVYLEVFRRYWIFLPSAFLSHRAAFRKPVSGDIDQVLGSFTTKGSKGTKGNRGRELFVEPYRNVLRMHGLIFFFMFAHFTGLDNFLVYLVTYVVYFFPWRLVRGEKSGVPLSLPKQG